MSTSTPAARRAGPKSRKTKLPATPPASAARASRPGRRAARSPAARGARPSRQQPAERNPANPYPASRTIRPSLSRSKVMPPIFIACPLPTDDLETILPEVGKKTRREMNGENGEALGLPIFIFLSGLQKG